MKTFPHIKIKESEKVRMGSVLIAQPFWQEEIYQHSVIIILDHDIKGTTGIIVNKNSDLLVHEALPELDISRSLGYGGPTNLKSVSYLHTNADVPGSLYLGNNLFWAGDYEFMQELINNRRFDLSQIKFCAGYVKWDSGELEDEIRESKWWVNEINSNELFTVPEEQLWSFKLISSGHIYGLLNDVPDISMS